MSKLAHSNDETMRQIERDRMVEDGMDPDQCPNCGAWVDEDGYSIDERCCFYCRAD